MNAATPRTTTWWFTALLIAVVLVLYAPSISYGLIWDDPKWYGQGAGHSTWQLFTALDTYQFYRPIAIWLNRQMVAPTGIVAAQTAHLIQVAAHLLATLAVTPVLLTFKFERRHARWAAVIFALNPLAFQAVAWQAPQQPIATLAVLVALLLAGRYTQRAQRRYLIASLAAYAFALLFQESALPFVFAFVWLAYFTDARDQRPLRQALAQRRNWWPLLHMVLAVIFFIIWLNVPRQAGITGRGLDVRVIAYALQGIVFPLAGALSNSLTGQATEILLVLFAAVGLALTLGTWAWQGRRSAAFGAAWIVAGLLPVVVGLSWSYVRIGSRLLYPAALGIAILWGGWLTQISARVVWRKLIGAITIATVITIAAAQWWSCQQLYHLGTRYLAKTIETLTQNPDQSLLFINYPDRLELLPPPYPLGNWGLILSPVVQNLADYAIAQVGYSAHDVSRAVFQVGADQRGAWPYDVFLRGEDTPPEELAVEAAQADRVWLTAYTAAGELLLQDVGVIRPPISPLFTARFDDRVRLSNVRLWTTDVVRLELVWQPQRALREGDTIFVHVWRDGAFVAAYDGDSLGGLLPPAQWPLNLEVVDVRTLPLTGLAAGRYEVRVGVYNRNDGTRLPAFAPNGAAVWDNAVSIGTFDVP